MAAISLLVQNAACQRRPVGTCTALADAALLTAPGIFPAAAGKEDVPAGDSHDAGGLIRARLLGRATSS